MDEVRRIRNERGLSQQGLADSSGVNKVTINHIEQGKANPSVSTLDKLARALDVEVGDFFPKAQAPLPLDWDINPARGIRSEGLYKVIDHSEKTRTPEQKHMWEMFLRESRVDKILNEFESGIKSEDEAIEAIAGEIVNHLEEVEAPERVLDE
jgi:transcriptional regulator with XRE-family HTH domain